MILTVQPQIRLSGGIDKIFEEIANPTIAYNFVVSLTREQIRDLLDWMVKAELLSNANELIQSGGSEVPGQLMLEFIAAVEQIQK